MPTAVADKIASSFVGHDINLQRLQASQRLRILRSLKNLENSLALKIMKDVDADKDTFTLARNRILLKETTRIISAAYAGITDLHKGMLKEMGTYELRATATVVNRLIGVNLLGVGVPDSVIDSMLKDDTIFGTPLKAYWEQQSATLRNKFATEMRAGIFAGETPDQLVRRVRGTKALNFKDGLMKGPRHGAEVVVRTAAQSVVNDARMEVYKANEDVLDGVQALVTLDDRTSDICMARSGFAWDMAGNPFPDTDTDEDFPGPPPWHPNCRSTLIPIVKSIGTILGDPALDKKIEREVDKLPKATQSSMTGQVAGDLTYEDWLRLQDEATQLDILGPGRFELWNKGKISLRDLIDQRGNPLTLKELRGADERISGGVFKSAPIGAVGKTYDVPGFDSAVVIKEYQAVLAKEFGIEAPLLQGQSVTFHQVVSESIIRADHSFDALARGSIEGFQSGGESHIGPSGTRWISRTLDKGTVAERLDFLNHSDAGDAFKTLTHEMIHSIRPKSIMLTAGERRLEESMTEHLADRQWRTVASKMIGATAKDIFVELESRSYVEWVADLRSLRAYVPGPEVNFDRIIAATHHKYKTLEERVNFLAHEIAKAAKKPDLENDLAASFLKALNVGAVPLKKAARDVLGLP